MSGHALLPLSLGTKPRLLPRQIKCSARPAVDSAVFLVSAGHVFRQSVVETEALLTERADPLGRGEQVRPPLAGTVHHQAVLHTVRASRASGLRGERGGEDVLSPAGEQHLAGALRGGGGAHAGPDGQVQRELLR